MAKNNLIAQLRAAKDEGRLEGIVMGLDIAVIAYNHVFHIANKRLPPVDAECQRILDEIQEAKDIDRVLCDIYKELVRIRPDKESDELFLKRYIKT